MTGCAIGRCRGEAAIDYLGHGICADHWNRLTADDAPPDALRTVLGLDATAAAAEENDMATKKKTTTRKKTASKKVATQAKGAAPEAPAEKKRAGPKPDRTFAIRITGDELAAIHKASGPRNATRFVRAVAAAFAKEDVAAFEATIREAREARG